MNYSSQQLTQIAKTNPQELIKIINNCYGSDMQTISLAIDIMGEEVSDEALVTPLIRKLLKHIHVLIRESAIMCVASFYIDKEVPKDIANRLEIISKNDPSNNLKELARDTLKDLNKLPLA